MKLCIPRTEQELELWFLLMELYEFKKENDKPFNLKYPYHDLYENRFLEERKKYLELVKNIK